METRQTVYYSLVIANFIKNGEFPITERHGVKGGHPISDHDYKKVKASIIAMRNRNYKTDNISPIRTYSEPITKEQYEDLFPYLRH